MDRNYVYSEEAKQDGKLFTSTFRIDHIYKRIDKLAQYEKLLGFGNEAKPIFMRVHCKIGERSYSSGYKACNMYVETICVDGNTYGVGVTQGAYFTLLKDIELTCLDSNNYSLQNLLRTYLNSK